MKFISLPAADAELYTNENITKFWKKIVNHQHVETALEILGESVTQKLFEDILIVGPNEIPAVSYNHQQYNFAERIIQMCKFGLDV